MQYLNHFFNPVTKGLERVIIQFASPIQYSSNNSYKFTTVLNTSDHSGFDSIPIVFDINKQWNQSDFNQGSQCIGGILENVNESSKMIVFTDGDFPIGGAKGQQVNEDNVSLLSNSVDWLSDDTGLIDLRTKAVATRPIEELDDNKRSMYKYLNFRSTRSKRKRLGLMEERYV